VKKKLFKSLAEFLLAVKRDSESLGRDRDNRLTPLNRPVFNGKVIGGSVRGEKKAKDIFNNRKITEGPIRKGGINIIKNSHSCPERCGQG
jgi:hypothetical protein